MAICLVVESLIDPRASVSEFFDEVVRGAAESRGYDPAAPSALYVAGLLAEYAKPEAALREALARPLTIVYREALETVGPDRFRRLRGLGDDALYLSGFFADYLERRGTAKSYVGTIGRAAYDAAGAMLRRAGGEARGPDVFGELATNFDDLVLLLGDVADAVYANGARDPRGLLDVYERWTRRGSHALAAVLATWGVVPTRGNGTVH